MFLLVCSCSCSCLGALLWLWWDLLGLNPAFLLDLAVIGFDGHRRFSMQSFQNNIFPKHRGTNPLKLKILCDQYACQRHLSLVAVDIPKLFLYYILLVVPCFDNLAQFGTKAINSCLGVSDTGPRTIFFRKNRHRKKY